jgi:hypothetical protein
MVHRTTLPWVVALSVVIAAPAAATKYAGEFLKIPVGPRALGMGGAFTAVADDATSPYWNPAGMVFLPYREVMFQHTEKFGSLANHDYLGGVFPLGGKKGREQALGVSLFRFAVDDIPVTPRPGGLQAGVDFLDHGTDNNPATPGNGQGNGVWDLGERILLTSADLFLASASEMSGMVSYARHHGPHWTFGGNLKFVRQSLPDTVPSEHVTSFGAGIDLAATYMPTDAVTIGAMVKDVTTTYLAWSNGVRELVVPTLQTGAAVNFFPAERHALTWALDLDWGFERRTADAQIAIGGQTWDVRTGLEYWYRSMVALRAGANAKDLSFGAGVRYKQVAVDYAAQLHRFFAGDDPDFPDDTNLDATHLVGLGVAW